MIVTEISIEIVVSAVSRRAIENSIKIIEEIVISIVIVTEISIEIVVSFVLPLLMEPSLAGAIEGKRKGRRTTVAVSLRAR